MIPNSPVTILLVLFFALPQTVSAQSDFEAVRKQAMESGSTKTAITILNDFAVAELTSSDNRLKALEYLARFCACRGKHNQANEFVNQAKQLAELETDQRLLRNVLQIESAIANHLSEFERGVRAATRSIEISESLDPKDPYLAKPLNERAINYACLHRFDLAVKDYQRALAIAKQTNNDKLRMHLIGNIASAYDELKLPRKSIEYNLQALKLAKTFENKRCIAAVSVNLANSYLALDQPSAAGEHFKLAFDVAKQLENHSVMGMACTGLGDLDTIDNRFEDARTNFNQALAAFKKSNDFVGTLQIQTRILKLKSLQTDQVANIEGQIKKLEELLAIAEERHQHQIAIDLIDQLVEQYEQQQDWKMVSDSLVRKTDHSNILWSESNQMAILELVQTRDDLGQTQNYILFLIGTTTCFFIMAIVLLLLWRGKHLATKRLQAANIRMRQGQQEKTILERQLAEQHKFESLSTMSAGLIHDFNNYLMAIVSSAEVGQLIPDMDRKNELFENVLRTGMSASELTKSLSDYLGRGQLSTNVCEIGETIQNELNLWKEMAGSDIDVVFERNDVTAWVNMDPVHLNQIIANIIKNSREAIEQTGNIRIWLNIIDSTEMRQQFQSAASDRQEVGERYCQINFCDDGAGMTPQDVTRALDPYFSSKGIGRGLGLASANGIIERYDGKLVLQSKLGVGTEIAIILPMTEIVAKESSIQDVPISNHDRHVEMGSIRILLVEDEQSVGDGIRDYLCSYGVHVAKANDVSTALSLLSSESFDCIVTDFMLPDLTGQDLAQSVKEQDPDLPIILISGYAEGNVFDTELFDSFLAKPFPLRQLWNTVRNVIQNGQPTNQNSARL